MRTEEGAARLVHQSSGTCTGSTATPRGLSSTRSELIAVEGRLSTRWPADSPRSVSSAGTPAAWTVTPGLSRIRARSTGSSRRCGK
ncbi:hypothetical protein [Nonomuraea recticatena]|uniref:hypothetical protein n=1 Tax=Nonomuraea recticatena TaxID=46178 RepID=UPI00361900BD